MTEQEQKDLDAMKVSMAAERDLFYSIARDLDRQDERGLLICGHRNGRDKAIADTFRRSLTKLEKMIRDHERKYPD